MGGIIRYWEKKRKASFNFSLLLSKYELSGLLIHLSFRSTHRRHLAVVSGLIIEKIYILQGGPTWFYLLVMSL